MIAHQFFTFAVIIALGHCRPKLDRVEERNEELSSPDVTFAYHNPPNGDYVVREEETADGDHRLSKRFAENYELSKQKLVYLDPIVVIDDKTYSDLIKTSKSLEEERYTDNNEDDLEVAAAIVYRPLFVYRLQKGKRLSRRRNPRSIHSTLPVDSKSKLLYRTDNDLMTKVIIIFLPVYTHKSNRYDDEDVRAARSAGDTVKSKKQEENEILIAQPSDFVFEKEEDDKGDPLVPAESSVVHPLFLYRYRVAYYEKKEEKEKKKRGQ